MPYENDRFRMMVEESQDWFWEFDQHAVFTYVSPRIRDLLGYEPEDLIGLNAFDLMSAEEAERVHKSFDPIARKYLPFNNLENINFHKDGHEVVIESSGTPIFDDEGQFRGYRGIDRDITERKNAEIRLMESNEKLDAFVTTVAHDLRSPLTPIIGYAEFLREKYTSQLDERGLSCLTRIEEAATEMLSLMEDLLSLASARTLNRPDRPVSVDKVVARAIKNLESEIFKAEISLQVASMPSVRVPETFLIQIFDNLISNAVRYAGKTSDIIEIGWERTGEQVRFFVSDHGPGISEQERKRVFEIFYRGMNAAESKGTGIGLATVYKIARICGGRAWVEETLGGGCTFWVEMSDNARP